MHNKLSQMGRLTTSPFLFTIYLFVGIFFNTWEVGGVGG